MRHTNDTIAESASVGDGVGSDAQSGLLLVGHGTRNEAGQRDFLETAAQVKDCFAQSPVEAGFLELAEPTIEQAIGRLASQGVTRLVVSPVLLFAAGHVKTDIPRAVEVICERMVTMTARFCPALGVCPAIVQLSELRYREALVGQADVLEKDTGLLLVGRGSHDADATREMFRLAELRAAEANFGFVATGFVAMAQPRLPAALREIASRDLRRIVVQPHLLYQGDLIARIFKEVRQFAETTPRCEWLTTRQLGPAPALARHIADMAH